MRCTCPQHKKNKDGIGWTTYPCGQCIACRLNKVRDWTLRLMHEAKFHDKMVFLTLTYDENHLPEGRTLVKKHAQDYLKRLRYYCGNVRFFLCGEYGDQYSRPHYHLIVFGIDKDNPVFKGKKYDVKGGVFYVKSPVWNFGTTYIGEVSYNSCRYVASYVNKKVFGKGSKGYYEKKGIIPEFTLMSRRPGIGSDFVNFTEPLLFGNHSLFIKVKNSDCQDIMRTRYSIHPNSSDSVNLKKSVIRLRKVMMDLDKERQIIKQNIHSRREILNKLIKSLKQIIYWLTVIMPVIDGVKTVCKCVSAGIEAGRADVRRAKDEAEADLFLDVSNGSSNLDLDEFYKEYKNGK